MWKYTIISAVVLFLGASFLFYKNNDAMTASGGEVSAFQAQFSQAVKKSREIEMDKAIKRYAELRTAYFKQQGDKYEAERAEIAAADAPFDQEISKAKADLAAAEADFKQMNDQLKAFKRDAAQAAGVDDGGEDLAALGQVIADKVGANNAVEAEVEKEKASADALNAETRKTIAMAEAAKKLNAERIARISPADLECSVLSSDPNWDYVILDAGVNKGIVIGSRLAVLRGETKVCELNVTLVEDKQTSCDVVYSTLRPGDSVRPGDRVVSVRTK